MVKVKESLKLKGVVEIFVNGILEQRYENFITNNGAQLFLQCISGASIDPINYFAIDNGTGTYTPSTIALNNEIFRKEISSNSIVNNKLTFTIFIGGTEAVDSWKGIALSNSSIAGSGVLTNLRNVTFTHNSGDAVQVNWSIEVII